MPRSLPFTLFLVVAAFASAPAWPTSVAAHCMPADRMAEVGTAMLNRIVTSADPQVVRTRAVWGLPSVATSQVSYVANNATCTSAEAAYPATVSPVAPDVSPLLGATIVTLCALLPDADLRLY